MNQIASMDHNQIASLDHWEFLRFEDKFLEVFNEFPEFQRILKLTGGILKLPNVSYIHGFVYFVHPWFGGCTGSIVIQNSANTIHFQREH